MGSAAAGITHKRLRQSAKATEEARFVRTHSDRVKWEEQPLTRSMDISSPTGTEDHTLTGMQPLKDDAKSGVKARFYKTVKILLPHIGLTLLLLLYMAGGAAILMWMEREPELSRRLEKLGNVTNLYDLIVNESLKMCQNGTGMTESSFKIFVEEKLKPLLNELSKTHEYDDRFTEEQQLWTDDVNKIRPRWTYPAALLYSLTVITTTGYDHVSPLTDVGRFFAVFFGLVGIPLMFITAADIGKFLSEMVTKVYIKFLDFARYIKARLMPGRAARLDEAKKAKKSAKNSANSPTEDEILFGIEADEEERVELPIVAYFTLILGYCAIGGLLFNSFEHGPVWSFIHGFFFSFNTITTIGLGNIMVTNMMYLGLIVIYCIVGLAVITMCVDLASAQLKMLFTKLHYFGRKIRGARSAFFMTMSDDIKEAIRLIAALKKSRFSKENITLEDIKKFLEIELQYKSQPFVPSNIHFIQWADDEDFSERSNFMLRANLFAAAAAASSPNMAANLHNTTAAAASTNAYNGPAAVNNFADTANVHI